jgi:P27 family predicted phage terminase small subunit
LNEQAKGVWRRIVKTLRDCGLYSRIDRDALAMYCQSVGWWLLAQERLAEKGPVLTSDKGNLYQNPWWHTASKAFDQATKLQKSFGLSPAMREKIDLRKLDQKVTSLRDELSEILAHRRDSDGSSGDID